MDVFNRLKSRFSGDSPSAVVKQNRHLIGLAAVFLFALWIRLLPENGMQGLQALDPYMIARMAEQIATEGHLAMFDAWRYFPFTTPTFRLTLGNIFIPAYVFMLVKPLTGMAFLTYAQVWPAFLGALMVVVVYFIGKEAFDRNVGLMAAFFLASSAAVLHRSSAGWFEKEPLGGLFMLLSMYFFLRGWKRASWPAGILAGAALGLAKTSWGGAMYLYLFFPLVAFVVAFLDEDIKGLVAAYTPTFLLGHGLAVALNPTRTSYTSEVALGGFGIAVLIWLRHLSDELDLVPEQHLSKVVPVSTIAGFVLALLSPLYSQFIANRFYKIFSMAASGGPYGVIGTTVAENAPASAGQLVSQLGAGGAAAMFPRAFVPVIRMVGGWKFALIGLAALTAIMFLMLLRKYFAMETIKPRIFYFAVPGILLVAGGVLMVSNPQLGGSVFRAFVLALLGAVFLSLYPEDGMKIPNNWYYVFFLLWAATTIYGVLQRSRLMFLTAQSVSFMAGLVIAKGLEALHASGVWEAVEDYAAEVDPHRIFVVVLVLVLVPIIGVNAASAYGMGKRVSGSPNQLWMENLEYMRTETPVDSVILSWWDYGYWFESIGARAAIADGGNLGFYRSDTFPKINYPLADFLTAENHTKHIPWLKSLSVDYVVLDSTMIGKYSAVSTIHKRGGRPNSMQTFGCQKVRVQIQGSTRRMCQAQRAQNNQTYLFYNARGARFLVPIDSRLVRPVRTANGGRALVPVRSPAAMPPTSVSVFQGQRGSAMVSKFCSTQGVIEYDTPGNRSSLPGCLAWHPYRQHRQLVYIPASVMRSTLVQLYIMDGHNMPAFEKVPGGSNGFVKMWRFDPAADQQ